MPHSYTNLLYHIVFSTKDRRPFIAPAIAGRLHAYLGGGIRAEGGTAIVINGTSDHIHILARLRQDKKLADVLRGIKANSSKWIHDTIAPHERFAWQSGYAAFTVSQSQAERACSYIRDQQSHHCRKTFEEEFVALLKAHRIPFDPDHLFK